MFALLQNKLVRIAGTMSHIVSLQNISRAKLQAIMGTAEKIATPFSFNGVGGTIITQVSNDGETSNPGNMIISWQETTGNFTSKFGSAGSSPSNLPNDVTVTNDQSLIITEVFYNYSPFIFSGLIDNQMLYKTSVYVPRIGDMDTLLGE